MDKFGYILAIDQGTTGTKALLLDSSGNILGKTSQEITQIYPKPGWIEHDPLELFQSCLNVVRELLDETGVSPKQILAIGIANQRETTVIWDRVTGEPVSNAIVWQCRRSAEICEAIKNYTGANLTSVMLTLLICRVGIGHLNPQEELMLEGEG